MVPIPLWLNRIKIALVRWGIMGHRLHLYCVLFLLSATILLYKSYRESSTILFGENFQVDSIPYCNSPGSLTGIEGNLFASQHSQHKSKLEDLTLVQLQFVIRHGDRAPIVLDTLPNADPVVISCKFANQNKQHFEKLSGFVKKAKIFQISGAKRPHDIISEKAICHGGQLTPLGLVQHIVYGEYFGHSYKKFLKDINIEKDIIIKSTEYGRTIQSAAALMYGLFGDKLPIKPQSVKIHVDPDRISQSHFIFDKEGQQLQCPSLEIDLRTMWNSPQLKSVIKIAEPYINQYVMLLNSSQYHMPSIGRIVDVLYTRLCHGQNLPLGPNGGVPFKLAKSTFELAHQYITTKHSYISDLQTMSLISQIVQNTDALTHASVKKSPSIVIYSGHDSILVPLLITLGAHDGKWPPYASRVIFEIWYDSSGTVKNTINSDTYYPLERFNDHYVRVLYNGKSITEQIKFCVGNIVLGQLCQLKYFVEFVSDRKFEGDNFFSRLQRICVS